jgi:hypothetical protein
MENKGAALSAIGLAIVNAFAFVVSISLALSNWESRAAEPFEKMRQYHLGDMWSIAAMFFWIGLCITIAYVFRQPAKESPDATIVELLTTIKAELQWQRNQKEKEIHRAKASQSTKP